jgi:hypothetical protein
MHTSARASPALRSADMRSPSEQPLHTKNLSEVIDQLIVYFSASSTARQYNEAGDTETAEMVQHIKRFSTTAITMNDEVRSMLYHSLQAQMDAELGGNERDLEAWSIMDKALSSLLRLSDDQVRSLGDGLFSLMRTDKERERLRKQLGSDAGSVSRPGSRMSSLHMSPSKRRETIGATRESPRASNSRTESRLERRARSHFAQDSASPYADRDRSDASFFSPSAESPVSPVEGLASSRLTRVGSTHARSTSEAVSRRTSMLLRREGSAVTASSRTLRAPPTLSPKRPTLAVAALSTGELADMFDDEGNPVAMSSTVDEFDAVGSASRRNTISGVSSLSRSSAGSPSASTMVGNSPRTSLQLTRGPDTTQDRPEYERSQASLSRFVSQSLSRAAGRRTSRVFSDVPANARA